MFIALFGFAIWLLIMFEVLLGLRVIRLGRRHRVVHKWVGYTIAMLAPLHGLAATVFFLGFPFALR